MVFHENYYKNIPFIYISDPIWAKGIGPFLFEKGRKCSKKGQQGQNRDVLPLIPLASYLFLRISVHLNEILSFLKGTIKTLQDPK